MNVDNRNRGSKYFSPITTLAGNAVPLGGVVFGGWSADYLVGTYLLEIVIVGILISFIPVIPWVKWEDKVGDFPRWKGGLYFFIFAAVHAGGAILIMNAVFADWVGYSVVGYTLDHFQSFWYASASLVLANLVSIVQWVRRFGGEGHLDDPMIHFLKLTIAGTIFIFTGMILSLVPFHTLPILLVGVIVVVTKTLADLIVAYRFSDGG
jgi:hypothetical protein